MTSDPLRRLGAILCDSNVQTNSPQRLRDFEDAIGTTVPAPYAEFLLKYGAAVTFDKDVRFHPREKSPWDRKDGAQSLELLYGLSEGKQGLARQYGAYGTRMPGSIIPIGESPGGNIIALGIRDDAFGKVYLWDHEDERSITGAIENDVGNMYLIANSFTDFLNSLQVGDDRPDTQSNGIVEAWLDETL